MASQLADADMEAEDEVYKRRRGTSSNVDADSEADSDALDDAMLYESMTVSLNGSTILTSMNFESLNGLMLCDPCCAL